MFLVKKSIGIIACLDLYLPEASKFANETCEILIYRPAILSF